MKKTPRKKNESKEVDRHEVIELPSENAAMEKYIQENRLDINKKLVINIEYAIKRKMSGIELFSFAGSNFVVVLQRKDFRNSLENIYEFSMSKEQFELCVRVKNITAHMDKLGFVMNYKKTKK